MDKTRQYASKHHEPQRTTDSTALWYSTVLRYSAAPLISICVQPYYDKWNFQDVESGQLR